MAHWDTFIQTGKYGAVQFDFVSTQDEIARVVDRQRVPYRRGAFLDDRTAEPRVFDIIGVFVEDDYPDTMNRLIAEIDKGGVKDFVHPIFGQFKALVTRASIQHNAEESTDSALMSLHVEEHTEDSQLTKTTTSIASKANAVRDKVLSVLNTVSRYGAILDALPGLAGTITAATRAPIESAISNSQTVATAAGDVVDRLEQDGDTMSALEVQAAVNAPLATADSIVSALGSMQVNGIGVPEQYDLVQAVTGMSSALVELANGVLSTKPQLITFQVAADISLLALANARYRDSSRADELLVLNPWIADPLLIPAGSEVTAYAA